MPKDEQPGQFAAAIGPETVVLQINLGGPLLIIPISHEEVLKWAIAIKEQQKAALKSNMQLVVPGRAN